METKICKKCGIKLPLDMFYIQRKYKSKKTNKITLHYTSYCKIDIIKSSIIFKKTYLKTNAGRKSLRNMHKNYRNKYPERYEKEKEIVCKKMKKNCDDLLDPYIKVALRDMGIYNPSDMLIEDKRNQLKLYRYGKI